MRLLLFFVLLFFIVLGSSLLCLNNLRSQIFGPQIEQGVDTEEDGLNQVYTLIWVDYHIAKSEYTFETLGSGKGVTKRQVDSTKAAQMTHARDWLEVYKKNKY